MKLGIEQNQIIQIVSSAYAYQVIPGQFKVIL